MNINSTLTLGAAVLLSLLILNVNKNILISDETMQDSKLGLLAVSLATSLVEEATRKAFDKATTDTTFVSDSTLLTPVAQLGPDGSEVYPNYDDFDDFNGYTRTVSNIPSAVFNLACKVVYVNPDSPSGLDSKSNARTWHKKITVTVTSPSMNDTLQVSTLDTVRLSSVYSYWYFR